MRIIWASISFSTVVCLMVGIQAARAPEEPPEMVMLFALAAVSLGLVGASQVVPKQLLLAALKARKFQVVEPPPEQRMFDDSPRRGRRFAAPDQVRLALIQCAQSPFILGLALSEAIAIMGLVLMLLGFELQHALGFFAVSWVLLLSKFPRLESFERLLEASYDAELGQR
ncbi:MAG TPA: hypothetical protein VFU02_20265 [Polyangiaceae bacterium]|nr:hypothetical protein [Polyangiaceae bacterium]